MKYLQSTLITIIAFFFMATAPVSAQELVLLPDGGTPDGLPPSVETVCDTYAGQAFGLCNAFCEAMDCELAEDADPNTNPAASATACSKVRTKFNQVTGEEPPCLPELCPCVGAGFSEWDRIAETGVCGSFYSPGGGGGSCDAIVESYDNVNYLGTITDNNSCIGPTNWCGQFTSNWQIVEITEEQEDACRAIVVDACE